MAIFLVVAAAEVEHLPDDYNLASFLSLAFPHTAGSALLVR